MEEFLYEIFGFGLLELCGILLGSLLGFLLYLKIWQKNKPLALTFVFLSLALILYFTADWAYWDRYFKLEWGKIGG